MKSGVTYRTASDRVSAGWAELRDGRWAAARSLFEHSIAEAETPEAYEGLSWAAWWLDDANTVFSARERAFRLYKQAGNLASAAHMATWLAADQLDFYGAAAVASGWLRRAHRMLDSLAPGPAHGWLAFHEGYLALAGGELERAQELAVFAATIGLQFAVADLEMLGLALEGATLVGKARIDEGMRCLDEATTIALEGEVSIPISSAWTCCLLVTSCTAVLDYERAAEWCDRIAEFADRYGSRYMLAFCRAEYGAIHLWRGRWSEAEALLEASLEDFSSSRPAWISAPLSILAELRRRQGRFDEVASLLVRAGDSGTGQLCRCRMWLDQGDALKAAETAERLLRKLPENIKLERARALELLIHARIARGDLGKARSALSDYREIEGLVGTLPMRACLDLAEGMLAAATGEFENARKLLEDAVDRYLRSGAPFETSQARLELATTLLALGRVDAARHEATEALRWFERLGAEPAAERSRRTLRACQEPGRSDSSVSQLTVREQEVLRLLVEGLTNRQIADQLSVSEHTVHRHVTSILRKLDLPSRTAAAARAVQSGMFNVPTA
jgi:LuxR family maltose regulon positive regulatory protein